MTTLVSRLPLRQALRIDPAAAVAAALGTLLVAPVAAVNGGYSPTSWGWVTLGLAWAGILALVLRADVSIGLLEAIAILALAALVLWSLVSVAWSDDAGASVLSTERLLVYATAIAVAALLVRAQASTALVGGVWAGATLICSYGVLTRMYPDRFLGNAEIAGSRLAQPVGYWNSLGLLAAVGLLVAAGLVSVTRSRLIGAAAAASLVPLALALYFTFSRGASIALAAGAVAVLVLDPRRLRFLVTTLVAGAAPAAAVLKGAHLPALTTLGASASQTASAGSTLMHVALVAGIVAALAGALLVEADRRIEVARAVRVATAVFLVVAVLAGAGAASARYGSPVSIAKRAWHSFTARPPKHSAADLNRRLFTLSNNGRVVLWRVAWRDFQAHPLNGSGAGSYYGVWVQGRSDGTQVRNAHSLYLETLAELGAPGLFLLGLALLAPLAAVARVRKAPLVPVATGAYLAFLIHTGFDWDWQLPGVALAPLLLGAALLAAARPEGRRLHAGTVSRAAAVTVLVVAAGFAVFALVGNRALASTQRATTAQRWAAAESNARRASSLQPWSAEPSRVLGEAKLQQGRLRQARASFRTGLAKNPHDWRLWLDLALASQGKARPAAARRALALNPHSVEIARISTFLRIRL